MKPQPTLIGITTSSQMLAGSFCLSRLYVEAVRSAGGVPVLIPAGEPDSSTILSRLDGLIFLAAIAGLFHGYAYGESIVGAQMTPLFAYLLGFSLIQYGVALVAYALGNAILNTNSLPWLRLAGMAICAIGVVFLTSSILS